MKRRTLKKNLSRLSRSVRSDLHHRLDSHGRWIGIARHHARLAALREYAESVHGVFFAITGTPDGFTDNTDELAEALYGDRIP